MRFLLLLIAVLALAAPALAKPPSDPHHPPGKAAVAAPGPQGMGMMQGMMKCPMAGHEEGTLAFLKTELNITSAQAQVWNAFASAYRDVAAAQGSMMGGGMMSGGMTGMMGGDGKGSAMIQPLPDRLAMHTQMMERHLDAAKKLQTAIQPLYAALDSEQKKKADELMPMIAMMAMM